MAVTYIPNSTEKNELDRLKSIWDSCASVQVIWKARIDLLTDLMTSVQMSNAGFNERCNTLDNFKVSQTWFQWRSLFGGVIQLANGNVNRTAYLNAYVDQYNDAVKATDVARQKYIDFKAVLDSKTVDLVAAQSDLLAAETENKTVKYIVTALIVTTVIYVAYRVTLKYL